MRYNFLILCALFALPPLAIAALRPELRRPMAVMAVLAQPFALTESWFYPEYWQPEFLFDLADRLGFGIEDLLFVGALSAFTCGAYPFVARRRFTPPSAASFGRRLLRVVWVLAALFAVVGVLRLLAVPVIYGACLSMLAVGAAMIGLRRDLFAPCLAGALVSVLVYTGLCLVFGAIFPTVFRLAWHTERLSNLFVLGVPFEELAYGFSAGFAGSAAYPFLSGARFLGRS